MAVGTGEFAHEWAYLLRDEIARSGERGLPVALVLASESGPHVARLMETLGVPVVIRSDGLRFDQESIAAIERMRRIEQGERLNVR